MKKSGEAATAEEIQEEIMAVKKVCRQFPHLPQ